MPYFISSTQASGGYFRPSQTIRLKNVIGNPITTLPFFSLDCARSVNSVGGMTVTVPATYPYQMFAVDNRLEFWRTIDGTNTSLEMDTAWLIKSLKLMHEPEGRAYWEIQAEDFKTIVRSRIVAYNQGTSGAKKTATTDNLMKAVARENLGSSATVGRNISTYLSIQADQTLGASITKAFEYRNLDELFGEIVEASLATASPVYFDIVMTGATGNTPEFRTYVQQRGSDRRAGRAGALTLSPESGNVGGFSVTDSYLEEATFVYALGPGNLGARMIGTASDATKIARSPWGRIETKVEGSNDPVTANLTEEANAALQIARPRKIVEGTILQNTRTQYGRDWKFGDRMTFRPNSLWSFDVRVDAVHLTISEQRETVDAYFRG